MCVIFENNLIKCFFFYFFITLIQFTEWWNRTIISPSRGIPQKGALAVMKQSKYG